MFFVILEVMSTQKIITALGALIVLGALVYGATLVLDTQSEAPAEITYILESVKDGTYSGEVPPLEYEVAFGPTIPEEARDVITSNVTRISTQLTRYPYDGNQWMNLALQYYQANDFAAAERVWTFIASMVPANVTAFENLGRLYHFEYKKYEQAEEYFKKAIEANPDRKEAYFELFDLYRYSYKKDTSAAVDIMKVGAERFPDDVNFPAGLGVYYRDSGRPNQARVYFEKALSMAREIGDVNLIQNFTNELSRL